MAFTEILRQHKPMGSKKPEKVQKVKKLENILKRRNVVLTTSEDEEPEDQGRIFKDIDDDPLVSLLLLLNLQERLRKKKPVLQPWKQLKLLSKGLLPQRASKHDVYPTKRIIAVTKVKVMKWYNYGYLEEIEVRREDQKLYKFKEGDFPILNLHDIEDMLLLLV
ncbi:hypothetical protein Tco_0820944 [Tanacetum coccineum]|uniref:Uncharacterized protein n=1 Tax=Tanacetum coccineum TaxID=301880 RepID=A0ABQ5AAX6_9ASTR